MSNAINDVIAERQRQDARYGGPGHDDEHNDGSLTVAGVVYAIDSVMTYNPDLLTEIDGFADVGYALNQISPCRHSPADARPQSREGRRAAGGRDRAPGPRCSAGGGVMPKPIDLVEVIRANPGCKAIIDNDCWYLEGKDGKELVNSSQVIVERGDGGYGSGDCYGGDILQALAAIVGITVESV